MNVAVDNNKWIKRWLGESGEHRVGNLIDELLPSGHVLSRKVVNWSQRDEVGPSVVIALGRDCLAFRYW